MAPIKSFISGCEGLTLSHQETQFFQSENPWGLILFKRNCESPEQVKALIQAFRNSVGRKDAPVFIDQEGGRVQRLGPPLAHWRKYPAARKFGELFSRSPVDALRAARNVGRLMAEDLIEIGITVDFLPVLDVPQQGAHDAIGNRAYSLDATEVVALAHAHTAGLIEGGVLPVIKHMPGHGRAEVDSHYNLPIVTAKLQDLERSDFMPFAALANAPMGLTAHVIFTAIDKENPATTSKKLIKKIIRQHIGFQGLLMTDDLSMKALAGTMTEKCQNALSAGCDMLLHCNGHFTEMQEVAKVSIPLKGKALSRAKLALKSARKPQKYDKAAALKDLDLVMGTIAGDNRGIA